MPTIKERTQQLTCEAIWDAALQLFAQKGFDKTTIDEIAVASGISRRTFFRYFDSKGDLMAKSILDYGTSLADAIRSFPQTDSLSEVLRGTVLLSARRSAEQPRTRLVMAIAAKYPEAREAQRARVAELHDIVAQAFAERSRASGRNKLTEHVLAGLTLFLLGLTFRSWFESPNRDITATVDQILGTVRDVLCDQIAIENQPGKGVRAKRTGSRIARRFEL